MAGLQSSSWEKCGRVGLDTATVALGDPAAFLARYQSQHGFGGLDIARTALLNTMEDAEYPVEKLVMAGRIAGVRVELVNDLAELPGKWVTKGEFTVESQFVVVVDPGRPIGLDAKHVGRELKELLVITGEGADVELTLSNGIVHGCAVRAVPGLWRVEVFVKADGGDELGIRLLRA